MSTIVGGIVVSACLAAICQMYFIGRLCVHYARAKPPARRFFRWPRVAVVLSLRGADPHLEKCLQNLVTQQYSDFELHVLVDSETDPVWKVIDAVRQKFGPGCMKVSVLNEKLHSCSLKNSAIIQAIKSLPEDIELVAFVDADAITYSTWLRDLVSPFENTSIGCTTGVRWFAPTAKSFGASLRFHWNVIAAPMIFCSHIPWGGSMVVRRTILDSGLTEEWSRMFCEDAHTIIHLRRKGFRVACVPQATIINSESTTLDGCVRFVNRQMLILRLYNQRWWRMTAFLMVATVVFKATYLITMILLMVNFQWLTAAALFLAERLMFLVRYQGARRLHAGVEKAIRASGRQLPAAPRLTPAIFVATELLVAVSVVSSFFARSVVWRGIQYGVKGPESVSMSQYAPFSHVESYALESTESLI